MSLLSKFRLPRSIAFLFLIAQALSAGIAFSATSVSQYGITWTFTSDRPVGQFANGDWWVVGPVTISNINPKPANSSDPHNGSMLNPIPGESQGLHGTTSSPPYTASKNIGLQLPYNVAPGNSVVSTVKNPDTWASTNPEKTYFKEVAVLTVLGAAPPAGSFRPPYAGTDKTIKPNWRVSSLNYGVLRKLAPPIPANVPNRQWMETATQRPLLEMHYNYLNSNWKASWAENKPGGYPRRTYGREVSHISSGAGLYLQTNVSDAVKEKLLIHMCQWGIDVFGLLNAGMRWQPNGGHNHGRLMPLYIAAKTLNDAEMLARCTPSKSGFQEFSQHWFVTQNDINTPRNPLTTAAYNQSHLGMPEWSSGGPNERNQASSDFWKGTAYRFINGAPNSGLVATILLMNGRAEINHEPLMRYVIDRHYPATRGSASHILPGFGDNPTLFTRDMWNAYVNGTTPPPDPEPPPVTPPQTSFKKWDRIAVIRTTNVRASAGLTATKIGEQAKGSTGTITDGPLTADNIIWWWVEYDDGTKGWSGSDNFEPAPAVRPIPTPSSPTASPEVFSFDLKTGPDEPDPLKVVGNCVVVTGSGPAYYRMNAGNSAPNAGISQWKTVQQGTDYVLTFNLGVIAGISEKQSIQVLVSSQDGLELANETHDIYADLEVDTSNVAKWENKTVSFKALNNRIKIEFRDVSGSTESIDLLLSEIRGFEKVN